MSKLKFSISLSLDGFMAGPDQSIDQPLGVGGMRLHDWAFALEAFQKSHGKSGGEVNASTRMIDEMFENVGAVIMGRNMFGPVRGPWQDTEWKGWWGNDPPYHMPVFVLTHHARAPEAMQGGTIFRFVTDGVEPALRRAQEAAQGKDVLIAGGASTIRQFLALGLVDEMNLSLIPILLGAGERLLDNLGDAGLTLEQTRVIDAPGVTHLRYRVIKRASSAP
jgi:dihydrofolate reductase